MTEKEEMVIVVEVKCSDASAIEGHLDIGSTQNVALITTTKTSSIGAMKPRRESSYG